MSSARENASSSPVDGNVVLKSAAYVVRECAESRCACQNAAVFVQDATTGASCADGGGSAGDGSLAIYDGSNTSHSINNSVNNNSVNNNSINKNNINNINNTNNTNNNGRFASPRRAEGLAGNIHSLPSPDFIPFPPPTQKTFAQTFRRFLSFCGPGYMIAVGYMDPGNWATDIEAGSRFGCSLLYVILLSNVMAMVLQHLCIRLGVKSRRDLAQNCRDRCPFWLNVFLYVVAEIAIISCDLSVVIGTAIALQLLFNIPIIYGAIITVLDVLLLLAGFSPSSSSSSTGATGATASATLPSPGCRGKHNNNLDEEMMTMIMTSGKTRLDSAEDSNSASEEESRQYKLLELLVIFMMSIVGACFIIELFIVKPDWGEVFSGFLPQSTELFKDRNALVAALGIIGATVMPHNLYLHSSIVKYRLPAEPLEPELPDTAAEDPSDSASASSSSSSSSSLTSSGSDASLPSPLLLSSASHTDAHNQPLRLGKKAYAKEISSIIKYATMDTLIALFLALLINAAILIVAAFAFHRNGDTEVGHIEAAYELMKKSLGPASAVIFALALLAAGQSSTVAGTLAGQIVFEGFLHLRLPPWQRRLLTRVVAIVPAIIIISIMGPSSVHKLLIYSQVVLSFQLPFAIIPLIYFTFNKSAAKPAASFAHRPCPVAFCHEDRREGGLAACCAHNHHGRQDLLPIPLSSSQSAIATATTTTATTTTTTTTTMLPPLHHDSSTIAAASSMATKALIKISRPLAISTLPFSAPTSLDRFEAIPLVSLEDSAAAAAETGNNAPCKHSTAAAKAAAMSEVLSLSARMTSGRAAEGRVGGHAVLPSGNGGFSLSSSVFCHCCWQQRRRKGGRPATALEIASWLIAFVIIFFNVILIVNMIF